MMPAWKLTFVACQSLMKIVVHAVDRDAPLVVTEHTLDCVDWE
jgi:hypothetical protein